MYILNWFKKVPKIVPEYSIDDLVVRCDDLPSRFNTFTDLHKITNKYKVEGSYLYELDNKRGLLFQDSLIKVDREIPESVDVKIDDMVVIRSQIQDNYMHQLKILKYKVTDIIRLVETSGNIMLGLSEYDEKSLTYKLSGYVYMHNVTYLMDEHE